MMDERGGGTVTGTGYRYNFLLSLAAVPILEYLESEPRVSLPLKVLA